MAIVLNGTTGITTPEITLDNTAADGGQVVLKSSGFSNWNIDNYSGTLRAYYNSTELFKIDSSGRVAMPNQPAFMVRSSATFSSSNTVYIWDNAIFNRGSNYSTSTGRFTAPVEGAYLFSVTMLPNSTSNSGFYYIRKNGSQWGPTAYIINPDETISQTSIVNMAVNDYVDVFVVADGSESTYTSFCGHLIG